ncbi:hypothetical protein CHS0354_022970 [Potamilus streckersoni]|uniref:Aminopeptidase NAALADL1 n=1 Tax=Potamilus streckersoni TaxID=2493646 RepID=A0AAE0S594_9BIVA|nr:hypothetical protein CHS0354_022970 [Potamilus streckersoni]
MANRARQRKGTSETETMTEYQLLNDMDFQTPDLRKRKLCMVLKVLGLLCGGLVMGVLIGYVFFHNSGGNQDCENQHNSYQQHQHEMENSFKHILNDLEKENIRSNLQNYTSRQRLSGTDGVHDLVMHIAQQWRDHGLDKVEVTPYEVLLSYPNTTNPNRVEIVLNNGTAIFTSAFVEKPLDPDGNQSDIIPPYNSFAPAGIVEGDLVYVNYGQIEDFMFLKNNLSINVTNKIVIARYGKIFRGDKVLNAQRFNASGVILYSDPADVNINGTTNTYPHSWWMPDTGVQRGTVGGDGDYLTPFYPAREYAHRLAVDKSIINIKIPCQPIGYGDAVHFLRELGGPSAPDTWKGKLNITYRVGPGFTNKTRKVKLTVNNYLKVVTVENIIGIIKGKVEPDRYVLLGNHHDAWVFGAIDPLSGTAALTEITRVMGNMKQSNNQPQRTIVFCTWGGEEVGLIGSTEWVEEYMKVLYERAVAYINVDYAVDYIDNLVAGTSPLLQDPLYQAAKLVPNPDPASPYRTLYDIWNKTNPGDGTGEPSIYYSLGSGSDMATFYERAGVPSIDMYYSYDRKKWDIISYPLYHSAYETFHMYTTFIDPSFNYTLAMARLWGVLSWKLADETLLSFDVRRYAKAVADVIVTFKGQYGILWQAQSVNIVDLESASKNLTLAAQKFYDYIQTIDKNDPLAVRIVNDKMTQLERTFIDPEGVPGRPIYKHVMFAPSKFDSYTGSSFPGIVDTMFEIQHNNASSWELLKQQVYVTTYTIQSAANSLDPIGL